MEDKKLKEMMDRLSIPEPDKNAREETLKVAMTEFRAQTEKKQEEIKGSSWLGRLMGKKTKGGIAMNKPITIGAIGSVVATSLVVLMVFTLTREYSNLGQKDTPVRLVSKPLTPTPEKDKKGITPTNLADQKEYVSEKKIVTDVAAPKEMPHMRPKEEDFLHEDVAVTATKIDGGVLKKQVAGMEVRDVKSFSFELGQSKTGRGTPVGFLPDEAGKPGIPDQTYVGRDRFEDFKPNPQKLVSEDPVSTFSIDVDTASYAFVRRALNSGHLPQVDAVRIEEMINYFDYAYAVPNDRSAPFKPTVAVFPTPWNPDTKLLHIGIKGYDMVKEEKPRSNLVFLLDVSGSMDSPDKLPLLKNSMKMLVDSLDKDDTVGIVVYAGAAGTVLEPTKVSEKGKILAAFDRLSAGGSTAGGEGIRMAYSLAEANYDPDGVNRVILATDGDFNVGIRDPEALKDFIERKRNTGIYLSVLGFGQGNYNDVLMQKLAQNGNGNAAYIDTLNEARKVLVDEAAGTLFTIAKDVKIQVEFNPEKVAEYRLIGYETRMLNREDFNNDKVDAGDIGSGHSVTAIYEITPVESKGRLIDDLRYGSSKDSGKGKESKEYAFLKIRYKLPEETESKLITLPIDAGTEYSKIGKAPEEARFASAVAAFGMLLKGDSYVKDFAYDDVIELARSAKGDDLFGYRSEFINLVRLAETAGAMGDR
jgi:Ca-activated chloride channel family protein